MSETVAQWETELRLGAFGAVFVVMVLWELTAPRRRLVQARLVRWYANISIAAINALLLRFVVPGAAIGIAAMMEERGWGLLNWADLPAWLGVAVAVVLLDLAIYLQHVLFHWVPALWRLHRMHHADLDFDVTTGLRFHPFEAVLSGVIKMAVVAVLGPPVLGVLIFEMLLNATSMFNHANVRLPGAVDGLLRTLVVTPDMHRVHHSVRVHETNSNFGFNLPWWDRLFGTYRAQPEDGHEAMAIGIEAFREPGALHLHRMLVQPFSGAAGPYPISRRSDAP